MDLANDIFSCVLSNGIRVVHLYDDSPVAYCGFAINVGTRDELEHESGMAHYIEHTLFKGTKKRRSWHILNRLDSLGGELNAYTTKEETFVYANILKEDYERAVELCSDIVFHSVFPQKELNKEVDVIIDEIHSYKDTPSELIYDEFEENLFNGTPLGRNILGDAKRLKKFKTEDCVSFVKRNYCTDKILFFSLGKLPFKKVCHLAEKYFGEIEEKISVPKSKIELDYQPFRKIIKKHTSQAHVMIGGLGYELAEDKRLPLALVNNILGGPSMNSRLNILLREKNGMAYNVESSYTSYSDSGIFTVYFGTDEKNRERCTALVRGELLRLSSHPLSRTQLERCKKQLMGQMAISQENRENLILSLAKSFLYFNTFETLENISLQLEKIDSLQLMEVCAEVFDEKILSELVYTTVR